MDPKLTVAVMAYDEARTLEDTVRELCGALDALGHPFEVIVIDDGSKDGTFEIADDIASRRPEVRAVHHRVNLGLGGVYRTGFAEARGELVTFFPADGQFPASAVGAFVEAAKSADLVLGLVPELHGRPPFDRALSAMERLFYRALFGELPRFQGLVMFRRKILEGMPLVTRGRGWGVLFELIVRAVYSGAKVAHVETPLRPRAFGVSKVRTARTIASNVVQALALRARL